MHLMLPLLLFCLGPSPHECASSLALEELQFTNDDSILGSAFCDVNQLQLSFRHYRVEILTCNLCLQSLALSSSVQHSPMGVESVLVRLWHFCLRRELESMDGSRLR